MWIVKVTQNDSVISVTRFFRYLVNKKLRRRPFFWYSSEFRYLGFRYSSRYLYTTSLAAAKMEMRTVCHSPLEKF